MSIVPLLFLVVVVSMTAAFPLEDTSPKEPTLFRMNWEDMPNPLKQHEDCGRAVPSYVCDPDGILRPGEADKLDFFIGRVKNDTACFCSQCYQGRPGGITMSVALVKRVYRHFHEEVSESVANFANHLRKSWNLGMCDDDVLIVVATEDRQSFIESGKLVATAISTEETDKIFIENKLHFESGSYYQGLESIIQSYYDVLRRVEHRSPSAAGDAEIKDSSIGLAVGLVVGFIVLGAALGFGVITIRRRRAANSDKIHYDSTKSKSSQRRDSPPRPIVKKTVDFFPTTIYQQCSVEDKEKEDDSDELDANSQQAKAQVYARGKELSMVVEESSERGDEEIVSQVSETSTQEAVTPEIQESTKDSNDNVKKV